MMAFKSPSFLLRCVFWAARVRRATSLSICVGLQERISQSAKTNNNDDYTQ